MGRFRATLRRTWDCKRDCGLQRVPSSAVGTLHVPELVRKRVRCKVAWESV